MSRQILESIGARREVRLHAPHVKEQRRGRRPRGGRAVALELLRPIVALPVRRRRPVAAGKAPQIVGGHSAIVPMIRLAHFFKPADQLSTIVTGVVLAPLTTAPIRKRWPSIETS